MSILNYFASLARGKIILWCYLIWYLATVIQHFDPTPMLWINSLGISAVIGFGLLLSVRGAARPDRWQTLRLFMMPFGVSSFSALIKGHDYIFIFPTHLDELMLSAIACVIFVAAVMLLKGFGVANQAT